MSLTTGLVSYWKLDEGATGPYVDSHGSNDMTGAGTISSIAGVNGGNVPSSDNDTSAKISVAGAGFVPTGSFSVSAWLRWQNGAVYPFAWGWGTGVSTDVCQVFIESNNVLTDTVQFRFRTSGTTGASHNITTPGIFARDTWYHSVATYDTTTKAKVLYIDGVVRASATATHTNALTSNSGDFSTLKGVFTGSRGGKVERIALWDGVVLNQSQVDELYGSGTPPSYEDITGGGTTNFFSCLD